MKHLLTASALAAMFVVGGIYASQHVAAQNNEPCVGENCPAPDMQGNQGQNKKRMKGVDQNNQMQGPGDESQTGEQTMPRKKRAGNQQNNNNDVDVDVRARVDAGSGNKWRYDPSRHQRRHSKSATFRFYYGGYWYPQPYWEIYTVRPRRVSCGEGRAIVAERFNRVRVVECNGGTYTYLGRRQGDTFRILLNARTGRIVGRALI